MPQALVACVVDHHDEVGNAILRVERVEEVDGGFGAPVGAQHPDELARHRATVLTGRQGPVPGLTLVPVRILFVTGTTVGGSGRSQRELAARLAERGNVMLVLADPEVGAPLRRWVYEQLSDLRVHWGDRPGHGLIDKIEARPGRRGHETQIDGVPHVLTPVPENAFPHVVDSFCPDVVVGSSIERLTWRKVRAGCAARGVPAVLYVREVAALGHLSSGQSAPDAVVANAASLAGQVEEAGVPCEVFPSVIEVERTRVDSSREVALLVNPIESHGVDMVWSLADRLPEIPFVLQESWPLSESQVRVLEREVASRPNVELRRVEPPGPRLYRDTRVLLAPHQIDNRPRVIAEVQANGIPVVAADLPGIVEAVGPGGVVVPVDDVDEWCRSVERLWSDGEAYRRLVDASRGHSERGSISSEAVVGRFEDLLRALDRASRAAT
jgi:glycosyltransferase involved in cell wall biosynthesis